MRNKSTGTQTARLEENQNINTDTNMKDDREYGAMDSQQEESTPSTVDPVENVTHQEAKVPRQDASYMGWEAKAVQKEC